MSCTKCKNPIVTQGIQALGKPYHKECFTCDFCQSEFQNGQFISKYERVYCKNCDGRLFGTYCSGCQNPIEGQSVKALNMYFHPDHFKCSKCHKPLQSGGFVEKNAKPFCVDCSSQLV